MTDTYENKAAWLRCVKNARQAGVLDSPRSVSHVKARTLAEVDAMREQNREVTRAAFTMPPGYERIKWDER